VQIRVKNCVVAESALRSCPVNGFIVSFAARFFYLHLHDPRIGHALSLVGTDRTVCFALAWLLAKPFVTTVIFGAKSMDQLRDNIASTRVQLDDAEERQLDEISALPPEYPGWMLAFQGQARAKAPAKE
jgi:aldo/keto reductase family protein